MEYTNLEFGDVYLVVLRIEKGFEAIDMDEIMYKL